MRYETLAPVIDALERNWDRPAVIALRREGQDVWTFAKLAQHVQKFAKGISSSRIERGESVALLAENRPETFAACLGVIRAGRAIVPIDVQHTQQTLKQILRDSEARTVLTTTSRIEQIEGIKLRRKLQIVLLDADRDDKRSWLNLLSDSGELPEIKPDDPATLFYTSGTTGPPKGVPLTHRNLAFQVETVMDVNLLRPDDRALLPLPLHHVYPLVIGMLVPLALGRAIVLPHALTGPQIVRAIQEGEVTAVIGVPKLYRALYTGIETKADSAGPIARTIFHRSLALSMWLRKKFGIYAGKILLRPLHKRFGKVRLLASGGSPLDPDLAWKLEAIGWQIAIGYGLTETSPLLTLNLPGTDKLDTVGKPIPGVELRIDPLQREDDERKIESNAGEVVARGPGVFAGYRNLSDKTEEAFTSDGWFRTGDIGYFDDDGHLHLLGRASTMIVSEAGENIAPEDVEDAYAADPAIDEVGILQKGGKIVAVVVPAAKDSDGVVRGVERISRTLPSYKRVTDIQITHEKLPRTRLGKIRRHLLEEQYDDLKAGGKKRKAARPVSIDEMSGEDRALLANPVAQQVWEWLVERCKDEALSPESNLQSDLGVDSIEWLNLTLEIGQRTGVEISEQVMAEATLVRDLLREVSEQAQQQQGQAARAPLDDPESVLTDEQKRWLQPRGALLTVAGWIMYGLNWAMMRLLFRVRVVGVKNLPTDSNFILAANHVSYLDPFVLGAGLGYRFLTQTYWAGWTGAAFTNPVTRFVSRVSQVVPIDPERGVVSSLAFAAAVLKRKRNLAWFPEGERTRTGKLIEFKPGIGIILEKYPVPVVPVFIHGAYEALPRGKFLPRLCAITIVVGQPVDPDELEREGKGDTPHARIAEALHHRVAQVGSQPTARASEKPSPERRAAKASARSRRR